MSRTAGVPGFPNSLSSGKRRPCGAKLLLLSLIVMVLTLPGQSLFSSSDAHAQLLSLDTSLVEGSLGDLAEELTFSDWGGLAELAELVGFTTSNQTNLDNVVVCDQDAGDPEPNTQAWFERDQNNVACSAQRQQDMLTSPAFFRMWLLENARAAGQYYPEIITDLMTEPHRLRINPIYFSPSAKVGDPFRNPEDWESAGRGQMVRITFLSRGGAHMNARLYSPNPILNEEPLPAIVFMPGLQSYNEVNSWFAQGMAEEGYLVLIVDPQGQGSSENLNHNPDGTPTNASTSNIPSSLDFLLSTPDSQHPHAGSPNAEGALTYNPLWARVDPDRIGIAGHSMGAIESRNLAHTDPRVKAAVNYDDLGGAPTVNVTTPVLYFYTDYAFPAFSIPKTTPPNPGAHMAAFNRLSEAGVDVMAITTRASTHYEWGYQPFPSSFPASRYGERVSFHYSLAWFDRFLKGDASAIQRLVTPVFDGSADRSSIGAGTYDPELALQDPLNPRGGNVPYQLDGKCAAHLVSFYFRSAYYLESGAFTSDDMRARGCEDGLVDLFHFADVEDAKPHSRVQSDIVVMEGFEGSLTIRSASPGQFRVNGGQWIEGAEQVSAGDTLQARIFSADAPAESRMFKLDVTDGTGLWTSIWTVTTVGQ